VDEEVIYTLKEHKETQNQVIKQIGNSYYNKDFIFAKTERQYGIAGLSKILTPHSLRHMHTSLLAQTGVSLEQIMDRLGHTDDQITKNVYLHVTQDMKKEASHKFAELMRSLR
jgi:integrase